MRKKKEREKKELASSDATLSSAVYSFEPQISCLGTVGPWVLLLITLNAAVFKVIHNFPHSQDMRF